MVLQSGQSQVIQGENYPFNKNTQKFLIYILFILKMKPKLNEEDYTIKAGTALMAFSKGKSIKFSS